MLANLSRDAKFRIFLTILSAIGLVLILLTTSKYGAGVSSDAARNLSTADSLLAGKGFVDMIGSPFVLWPPLYPLVMAGLSLLTGWSTFQAAWYLNVALYAVNLWLSGWLLYQIFKQKLIYAIAGALIVLLSRSTLRIYANVASEPLFATFMLLYFLVAAHYLQNSSRLAVWGMFVLAGLAMLQRYLGVVLFGVAAVAVFYKERWRGILRALAPAVISALPIAAWVVLHNLPQSGALFGPRDLGEMLPLENIGLSLTKILWWFIPRLSFTDPILLHPWMVIAAVVLALVLLNRRGYWQNWFRRLADIYVWPALLFSVVYFFLLAFTVVTADHLDLTSDRYYVVILPAVIALVFITLDMLVLSHLPATGRPSAYAFPIMLIIWFVYPAYSIQAYVREALVKGEPTNYNIANSMLFREMRVVKAAESILAKDPTAPVYSNYINIVWFIFRHRVRTLPFEDQTLPPDQRLVALRQSYPGWPPERGYIIWFTPNQYHHIAAPAELATFVKLELLYEDKTGQIYIVQPGK
ncbi:MAG TPA: hypothetical protein VF784_17290 [Anaerolineales bacterium]